MIGGLFSVGFDKFIDVANVTLGGNITAKSVQPLVNFSTAVFSIYSCIFLIFFVLYSAKSDRVNCILLLFRILTLIIAVPILFYYQYYIDGSLTLAIVLGRFFYLLYFCHKFKRPHFLFYNTDLLLFAQGKCVTYAKLTYFANYAALYGGLGYVTLGRNIINFTEARNVILALRGRVQEDLSLARFIELANGDCIYIFTKDPAVSVYSFSFQPLN